LNTSPHSRLTTLFSKARSFCSLPSDAIVYMIVFTRVLILRARRRLPCHRLYDLILVCFSHCYCVVRVARINDSRSVDKNRWYIYCALIVVGHSFRSFSDTDPDQRRIGLSAKGVFFFLPKTRCISSINTKSLTHQLSSWFLHKTRIVRYKRNIVFFFFFMYLSFLSSAQIKENEKSKTITNIFPRKRNESISISLLEIFI
jgi:hypothetical protein